VGVDRFGTEDFIMLKGYHIRIATPTDEAGVLAFQRTAVAHVPAGAYPAAILDAWWRTPTPDIGALLADRRYVVAERGDALAGGGGWAPHDCAPATALVVGLFVHPAHQGTGLGRRLMRVVERAAAEAGYHNLLAPAPLGTTEFYEQAGYVPAEFTAFPLEPGAQLECRKMWKRVDGDMAMAGRAAMIAGAAVSH